MNILTLDTKSDERLWTTNTLKLMMQINFKSIGMGSLKFKAVNLKTQKCANRQKNAGLERRFLSCTVF